MKVDSRRFSNKLKNPVHKQKERELKNTFAVCSDFLEGGGSRGRGKREGFNETAGKLLHFELRSGPGDFVW